MPEAVNGTGLEKAWSSILDTLQATIPFLQRRYYLGKQWRQVFGSWKPVFPENRFARAMAEFKGWLYFGTEKTYGLEIWRSYDGLSWEPCVGSSAMVKAGFGDLSNYGARCMVVFGDKLFVGTDNGVWYTEDGIIWTKVAGCPSLTISAMVALNEYLYVSIGVEIWRGKWNTQWQPVVGSASQYWSKI